MAKSLETVWRIIIAQEPGFCINANPMSLFDLIFPEQAQAVHLRDLVASNHQHTAALRSQQYATEKKRKEAIRLNSKTEDRVKELENEVAQSALIIESLIHLLEEKKLVSRGELRQRASEIDAADGVIDGKITPPAEKPFTPSQEWPARTLAAPPSISPARPPGA
ncbi:MAG: hypothetical protein EOP87_04995 [Verrucomicrobiaceae bacterium]|nr:MAG: hypothetical protein EOP87_04995 [Verrucomicrobiaceae bacterium]